MPTRSLTPPSTRKLSEVARHVVLPEGIVTTGWPAVEARCKEWGDVFDEWQRGAGQAILGKRANGEYAATVGGITLSIPRQVAKTFLVGRIVFALCTLFPGLTVLWTAHHTRTTSKTFSSLRGFAGRKKVAPYLRAVNPIRSANGEQEIHFANGSVIMFGAREMGFGRGFDEVDVEVFDEAQILTDKALEDMVAATNQSRHPHGALLFFMGTPPRETDPGEAFTTRRREALAGESTDGVYIECSADENADPDDRAQWAKANPSYPHRTPLRSMLRLRKNLPSREGWLREALGIWIDYSTVETALPVGKWRDAAKADSRMEKDITFALDIAPDRSHAAVGVAGKNPWGTWHVGLIQYDRGTYWVIDYLTRKMAELGATKLYVAASSQAGLMAPQLEQAGLEVIGLDRTDVATACAEFLDDLNVDAITYTPGQPDLEAAVAGAVWTVGDTRIFNRGKSLADISPLYAVTLARHAQILTAQEGHYDPLSNIF